MATTSSESDGNAAEKFTIYAESDDHEQKIKQSDQHLLF